MQLSDVFGETNPIREVFDEITFQCYLKWLSELPPWKKAEVNKQIYKQDYSTYDLIKVFLEENGK